MLKTGDRSFTISGAANQVYDDKGELIMLSDAEFEREVMRALAPARARIIRTLGRKPRYRSAAQFTEDAIETHLRLVKKSRTKDLLEDQHEYSQEPIAIEMGFKDLTGWRRRA